MEASLRHINCRNLTVGSVDKLTNTRETPAFGGISLDLRESGAFCAPVGSPPTPVWETVAFDGFPILGAIFFNYSQMGAGGGPTGAPKAPLPRRLREIPPKAGVSRVLVNLSTDSTVKFLQLICRKGASIVLQALTTTVNHYG